MEQDLVNDVSGFSNDLARRVPGASLGPKRTGNERDGPTTERGKAV